VRRYISRGTLDLILRPFGTRPQICRPPAFFSCDPNLHHDDPAGNTAIYRSFTPFFVDARVSTGKITEDTLSLNRVVLGTEGEYRYVLRNETYPTFFRFIGRFVNASDRDFKQAEYKGTFEFRPVFAAINHPLSTGRTRQNAVIVGPGNQDDPQKEVASERGGYEFVPFFGGELGRTWARRNPAEAVEASDAVKRLYLGIDITLNPFKRTTLTLTDTFYFKYESKDDRRDNYFKGNIDFLLGKFFGYDRIGQSIFFSFERGQVPPSMIRRERLEVRLPDRGSKCLSSRRQFLDAGDSCRFHINLRAARSGELSLKATFAWLLCRGMLIHVNYRQALRRYPLSWFCVHLSYVVGSYAETPPSGRLTTDAADKRRSPLRRAMLPPLLEKRK
jgi:hypothetical protein